MKKLGNQLQKLHTKKNSTCPYVVALKRETYNEIYSDDSSLAQEYSRLTASIVNWTHAVAKCLLHGYELSPIYQTAD